MRYQIRRFCLTQNLICDTIAVYKSIYTLFIFLKGKPAGETAGVAMRASRISSALQVLILYTSLYIKSSTK